MNENVFLLHAFLLGIEITFLYDILRILRRVFAHGTGMVSLEDIAFWIYCAGKVFLMTSDRLMWSGRPLVAPTTHMANRPLKQTHL